MKLHIETIEINHTPYRVIKKNGSTILAREILVKDEPFKPTKYLDTGCWTLIHKENNQHFVIAKSPKRHFEKFIQKIGALFDE
jgi:hypothetical protein